MQKNIACSASMLHCFLPSSCLDLTLLGCCEYHRLELAVPKKASSPFSVWLILVKHYIFLLRTPPPQPVYLRCTILKPTLPSKKLLLTRGATPLMQKIICTLARTGGKYIGQCKTFFRLSDFVTSPFTGEVSQPKESSASKGSILGLYVREYWPGMRGARWLKPERSLQIWTFIHLEEEEEEEHPLIRTLPGICEANGFG